MSDSVKSPEYYMKQIDAKEVEISRLMGEMAFFAHNEEFEKAREKRAEIVRIRLSIYELQDKLEELVAPYLRF